MYWLQGLCCFKFFQNMSPAGGHMIKMFFFNQYRDPHFTGKTVWGWSKLYHGNPYVEKQSLYWNIAQRVVWIACPELPWCEWCWHYEHIVVIVPLDSVLSQEQGQHGEWHITLILPQRLFCSHLSYMEEVADLMNLHLDSQTLKIEWILNYFTRFWVETEPTHSLSIS